MTVCSATRRDSGLPYGLLRMPGIFDQLHAMGLISGPSIILILIAAVATASAESSPAPRSSSS